MTDEQYVDDDPSNVRSIGGRGQPIYSESDYPTTEPIDPTIDPIDWDDTPFAVNEIPPDARPSQPPTGRDGLSRRQQIIDEAAQLANQALEAWSQAIDVMGIIDIEASEKYSRLTKGIASAVEDWEKKL